MTIKKLTLGVFQANCYIYQIPTTTHALLIDPGDEPKRINRYLKEHELSPIAILLTHGHIDHMGGITSLSDMYPNLPIYIHEEDAVFLKDPQLNLSGSMLTVPLTYTKPVHTFTDGQILEFDNCQITCLHLPGHTPGSCMYVLPKECIIFSGDVLFAGSIGRYDFPLGNHNDMRLSLTKIKQLDKSFKVYPGHGDTTTIEEELIYNPFLKTA